MSALSETSTPASVPHRRARCWRSALAWGAVALLVFAVGMQFLRRGSGQAGPLPDFEALMPAAPEGWSYRDELLGPTESITRESLEVLQLDHYVYSTYFRNGASFSVYIAYWRRSGEALPMVASHLPDRCWSSSGMNCVEIRNATTLGAPGRLPQLEYRVFKTPTGEAIYVGYWLWFGGKPFDFGQGLLGWYDARPGRYRANLLPRVQWLADQALHGSREQYFVRCSANVPLPELLKSPEVEEFLHAVSAIGTVPVAPALVRGG